MYVKIWTPKPQEDTYSWRSSCCEEKWPSWGSQDVKDSNGEEEMDYSYLLNTFTELDFDEYKLDDDVWIKYLKNQCMYCVALKLCM